MDGHVDSGKVTRYRYRRQACLKRTAGGSHLGMDSIRSQQHRGLRRTVDLFLQDLVLYLTREREQRVCWSQQFIRLVLKTQPPHHRRKGGFGESGKRSTSFALLKSLESTPANLEFGSRPHPLIKTDCTSQLTQLFEPHQV